MQLMFLRSIVFALLGLLATSSLAAEPQRNLAIASGGAEKRVALVIGNTAYKTAPLKNAGNDAVDMASRLRGLGFEVIERNNITTRQIAGTLREFRSKLTPGAVALFFYAGHGLQIKGVNYLPATDADILSEEDVPLQSFDLGRVLEIMDESKTRLNLIFLDACRNNPFARSFRSASNGLAKVDAPSGTLISFATRPGSVAADGAGRNGLYTSQLLSAMNDTGQPIELVLKRVVGGVKAVSLGKQEPWLEGSIEGDFCFARCTGGLGVAASVGSGTPGPSAAAVEMTYWESMRDSRDAEAFRGYLSRYPNGQFADIADRKIKELARPAASVQPLGETSTWAGPEGSKFSLKLGSNNRFTLTRTEGYEDRIIVSYSEYRAPVAFELPLIIAGVIEDGRISGEYLQKAHTHNHWACSAPERRGRVTGNIDLAGGTLRLGYDRTTFEFESRFKSFFSSEFTCRLQESKQTPGHVLELKLIGTTYLE